MKFSVGDRVRVTIGESRRKKWARGSVDCLNGTTGVIEKIDNRQEVLVKFDAPARTWSGGQLPVTGFWFHTNELEALDGAGERSGADCDGASGSEGS